MAYLKRVFLNPISEGAPSFIQAVADHSDEGTYVLGNYLLIIADCEHRMAFITVCIMNGLNRDASNIWEVANSSPQVLALLR